MSVMRAWRTTGSPGGLEPVQLAVPEPQPDEVLVRVEVCGICRTDLHVVDHEIPVHRAQVVPGHQAIGRVEAVGGAVRHPSVGDRVGVAWLRRTCGQCEFCRSGAENLCPDSEYTGWDADGGFAELLTAPAAFVYPLDDGADPLETAPLLCAGIIGFRALERANLPPGGTLGLYGFGSSAHVTAQLALASGARVFAMTRGEQNRSLARELGAAFVGGEADAPPEPLDAAIVFAPAGGLVPAALGATRSGGTVVLAGIEMSDIPSLSYSDSLFRERDLRTVTANTRADGARFLALAGNLRLRPTVTAVPFEALGSAIADLREGRARGSLVLRIDPRNEERTMLERTVTCWNGSDASEAALDWALRRSRDTGTTIEVFDVIDRALFEGDPAALERASVQEEQRLAARLDDIAATDPSAVAASALLVGDPLDVLSEQTRPDTLVVVGTSRRTAPRMRYGWSLGARLATTASGPVAIVPTEDQDAARTRSGVVAGVDGSEIAARALEFAAAEAAALGEPLTVVHCWQEPLADEPLVVPDDEFVDSQQLAHQQLLDDQVQRIRAAYPDLTVEPVLLRRHPVAGLAAGSERARLLVVGSRRLTGWERTWLGSVSHGVVLHLAAPTVIVGPETRVGG
ncbi:zinc-binding alcohol dehydrogenase family protein [Leifsonia xyli]|uniref:zinc-binding alcohol dehydrogenase family protein n=1 Tax=Leifsonia xyli TaxID=1575 RepID=UPI003D66E5DE